MLFHSSFISETEWSFRRFTYGNLGTTFTSSRQWSLIVFSALRQGRDRADHHSHSQFITGSLQTLNCSRSVWLVYQWVSLFSSEAVCLVYLTGSQGLTSLLVRGTSKLVTVIISYWLTSFWFIRSESAWLVTLTSLLVSLIRLTEICDVINDVVSLNQYTEVSRLCSLQQRQCDSAVLSHLRGSSSALLTHTHTHTHTDTHIDTHTHTQTHT